MRLLDFPIRGIEELSNILISHRVLEHYHGIALFVVLDCFLLGYRIHLAANLDSVLLTEDVGVLGVACGLHLVASSLLVALLVLSYLGSLPLLLPGFEKIDGLILVEN